MQDMIKVAVDAMGGDNAPHEIVKGAVDAVNMRKDIQVCLIGRSEAVERELKQYTYPKEQIILTRNRYESGKTKRNGCFRFSRQFGGNFSWRTGDCWKDKRN